VGVGEVGGKAQVGGVNQEAGKTGAAKRGCDQAREIEPAQRPCGVATLHSARFTDQEVEDRRVGRLLTRLAHDSRAAMGRAPAQTGYEAFTALVRARCSITRVGETVGGGNPGGGIIWRLPAAAQGSGEVVTQTRRNRPRQES